MVDLYAGTGGATRAAEKLGWRVVRIDNDEQHRPDIRADISLIRWAGPRPLVLWASPPCQEFSRWSMPWCRAKNPAVPSMALVEAALRWRDECQPTYWIFENVRGAIPCMQGRYRAAMRGAPILNAKAHQLVNRSGVNATAHGAQPDTRTKARTT